MLSGRQVYIQITIYISEGTRLALSPPPSTTWFLFFGGFFGFFATTCQPVVISLPLPILFCKLN